MTAYQLSPNQPARRQVMDRRIRDAKLASIAETQTRTPATPHEANRYHFLISEPNGDTLLSIPSTNKFNSDVNPAKSAPEPKRQANRCTTLLGKYTVVRPTQAKIVKVKPGF